MNSKTKFSLWGSTAGGIFIADQLIKNFLLNHPDYQGDFWFFKIHFWQNSGIAFGLPLANNLVIVISLLIILTLTLCCLRELRNNNFVLSSYITLINYGAFSNFIDRIIHKGVIDYIDASIVPWPVFNLADILIVVGVLGWLIYLLRNKK
ncbi:MAG: signal peptidase II [Patescibacteria group bacterium]